MAAFCETVESIRLLLASRRVIVKPEKGVAMSIIRTFSNYENILVYL